MGRVMQAQWVSVPAATLTHVVTVPADHKYELLSGQVSANPGTPDLRAFLLDNAGGFFFLSSDQAGTEYVGGGFDGPVVAYAGDVVYVYSLNGAGEAYLTYIDVTF